MERIDFDFSWPVAECYEIRPIEMLTAPPKRGYGKPGRVRAADTILGGGEPTEPYEVVALGEVTWKRPLENIPIWHFLITRLRFHEGDLRPTVLDVAKQFGLLLVRSKDGESECLDRWQDLIDDILNFQEKFAGGEWNAAEPGFIIENIKAVLIPDPLTSAPTLTFRPSTLGGAIRLQLAHRIARGAQLKTCQHCGAIFEAGIEGKRGDAKFCADTCRHVFNNIRRKRMPKMGHGSATKKDRQKIITLIQ